MDTVQKSPTPIPPKKHVSGWIVFWMIMIAAVVFTFYSIFWPEHQREQLIRYGLPGTAVILNADPTGNIYNSQPEIRLRLRVTPADGSSYEAETEMIINPIYVPQFQPGKTVKIKYDREDRSKVAIEETENGQR